MNLKNYRLGYWPYHPEMKGPGDRRRFLFYCNERKLKFEIASTKERYDIVYLTVGCNITQWLEYKKRHPGTIIIFEVVDSYFLEGINIFSIFRGLAKFLLRKESRLYLNYKHQILKMVKKADAVVCSTPIQKDFLKRYNPNIHISLDYFLNDITHFKNQYDKNKPLKLIWEGQTYTVHNLLYLKTVLKELSQKIELHIITDPIIKYPFKIFDRKTSSLLSSLKCKYYIHEWHKESFSKIISEMDLAIIPLNKNKYTKITMNKPENKLLLFWQIGLPVLASESPAYMRVMKKANLKFYCSSKSDWKTKIEEFIEMSKMEVEKGMEKAQNYIDANHSKELILKKWDDIFASIHKNNPFIQNVK